MIKSKMLIGLVGLSMCFGALASDGKCTIDADNFAFMVLANFAANPDIDFRREYFTERTAEGYTEVAYKYADVFVRVCKERNLGLETTSN